jgi:hypothetical protein
MKTKMSIFSIAVSLVVLLALQIPTHVSAQGVELGDGVVITAEVVAIDRVDRTLALGDQLRIEYYESVAIYLGKPGTQPEATAGLVAARSKKGDKPAGVVVETVDVSATIQAIDKKKRTVTLKLPDGKTVTTKVDKSVKAFDTLKKGDSIHARYTEAIAISVEKP